MPYSYVAYTGNGATTQFAVPFGYIRREHVFVNINQVSQSYTWVNDSTVQLASAPANGALVEVRRSTPAASPLVDFSDGSTLVAADLDTSNLQLLYLEQELLDNQQQTVSVDPATGLPSLSGNRLTNVGNPVSAQDAATKTYVDTFVSQTANIANSAVTTAKLADGAVTSAKILDGTIAAVDLAADSVTTAKILDGNVTTAKVATGAITNDKLADADLQALAGAQTGAASAFALLTAAEVATLDGITASTSELNQLGGKTITGALNPANANDIPTSTAINSWVSNLVNALGGFVAIPNRTSFPTDNPDPSDNAGTVVSIADAGGLVVSAGGVATNAQTTGAAAVTITGFPAVYQSTTLVAGLGIQVQTTSTLNTYTFHKSIPTDADIVQLNDDINNFFARYRIGAVNPTTDLDAGDLFFNTTLGKMLVYDGITSSWKEVQSFGSFSINTLSSSPNAGGGSATFNSTAYRFTLSNPPSFAQQLIVSINGVVQKPNGGTTQPAEGFAIDQADIIFSQAPATGSAFFIVTLGSTVDIGAPSNGTVTPVKLSTGGPYWDTAGRLGIGTSSPGEALQVNGKALLGLTGSGAPATSQLHLYQANGTNGISWADSSFNPAGYIQTSAGQLQFGARTGGSSPANPASPQMTLVDGYLRLGAQGIQFNGDTAAVNALNDYEEGTWTGTIQTESGTNYTVTSQTCKYIKIGKMVHVQAAITFSAKGSGTIALINLPFVSDGNQVLSGSVQSGINTKSIQYTGYGTGAVLIRRDDGTAFINYWSPNTDWNAPGTFALAGTYLTV